MQPQHATVIVMSWNEWGRLFLTTLPLILLPRTARCTRNTQRLPKLSWNEWSWLILELLACCIHTAPMLAFDISSQIMGGLSHMCCSVVQCVAVWCSVVQCATVRCSLLAFDIWSQDISGLSHACCSVMQCWAVCCSVVQCAATCCSVL